MMKTAKLVSVEATDLFKKFNHPPVLKGVNILYFWLATDFSDDEGEESEKDKEEPEEWGKFLHLKERVSM